MFESNEDFDFDLEDFPQSNSRFPSSVLPPSNRNLMGNPTKETVPSKTTTTNVFNIFSSGNDDFDDNIFDDWPIAGTSSSYMGSQLNSQSAPQNTTISSPVLSPQYNSNKRFNAELHNSESKKVCLELGRPDNVPNKKLENILKIVNSKSSSTTNEDRQTIQTASRNVLYGTTQSSPIKSIREFRSPPEQLHNTTTMTPSKIKSFFKMANTKDIPNQSPVPPVKIVQERKFPGPAGLLPEIDSVKNIREPSIKTFYIAAIEKPVIDADNLCSQATVDNLNEGPWQTMLRDYSSTSNGIVNLPAKYTISWLKSRANLKLLDNYKSPFLAAVIECIKQDCNVVLKDETGSISGFLDKEVVEEYSNLLQPGAVVVLRQPSILSHSLNRHYINITMNNIVVIYPLIENETDGEKKKFCGPRYMDLNDVLTDIQNCNESATENLQRTRNSYNNNPVRNSEKIKTFTRPNSIPNQPIPTNFPHIPNNHSSLARPNVKNNFAASTPQSTSNSQISNSVLQRRNVFKFTPHEKKLQTLSQNSGLSSTQNFGSDIDIVNSTLSGIDADSIFGDFDEF